MSAADRSLAAEVRATEEGHRAFVQADGSVKVVSDVRPGKWYLVTFAAQAAGEPIRFQCQPEGVEAYSDDHKAINGDPGVLPCKHAAVAAHRLEREGLARVTVQGERCRGHRLVSGTWITTDRAAELTAEKRARLAPPTDAFDGLPS